MSHNITRQRETEAALRQANEALNHERAQMEAILDSMTEGVIFAQELQTRYINKALTTMTGYSAEAWSGHLELLKPVGMSGDEVATWLRTIYENVQHKGVWRGEARLSRQDGSEFMAALTASRVSDPTGKIVGTVTIVRDISDEKVLQEQKARFVANASHELRTPIANLKTRLYLLRRQPENLLNHIAILERVVERMQNLVEDLLDVTRFERGKIALKYDKVVLQDLIAEVVETQYPEAVRKRVILLHHLPPESLPILVDPERMIQVITNLIINAINYTQGGGQITVNTFAETSEDGSHWAVIEVRDSGSGIAPDTLAQIFQPFFRATDGRTIGTGLGLTIAKEIVQAHAGEISVESQIGQGSCFTVRLPLAVDS